MMSPAPPVFPAFIRNVTDCCMKLYLVRNACPDLSCDADSQDGDVIGRMNARKMACFLRDGGQFEPDQIWYGSEQGCHRTASILQELAAPHADLRPVEDGDADLSAGDCFKTLSTLSCSVALVGSESFVRTLFCLVTDCSDGSLWDEAGGGVVCINGIDYYCGMGKCRRRWSVFWLLSPNIF